MRKNSSGITIKILSIAFPVVFAASLHAQDVITIGGPCIAGAAPGSTVTVPVYIRDMTGTPLGVDQPAGKKIQAFSFKVAVSPASAIASDSGGLKVNVTQAGIAAQAGTPSFETKPRTSSTFSYVVLYDESSQPLPFTANAALPGNLVANIAITLSDSATAGSTISLNAAADTTSLNNQGGTAAEFAPRDLTIVDGCITVAGPQSFSLSLSCPTSAIGIGTPVNATVSISTSSTTETRVLLSPSNPKVTLVPVSVSIAAGQTSAAFQITPIGAGASTITASLPGNPSGSSTSCPITVLGRFRRHGAYHP